MKRGWKTNIGFPPPLFRTCRIAATYLAYEKKLPRERTRVLSSVEGH